MTEKIEANYDELERVQSTFSECASALENQVSEVRRHVEGLHSTWSGRGSDAFQKEMDHEVLVACKKLIDALGQAAKTTDMVSKTMQQAETDASGLFSKS